MDWVRRELSLVELTPFVVVDKQAQGTHKNDRQSQIGLDSSNLTPAIICDKLLLLVLCIINNRRYDVTD